MMDRRKRILVNAYEVSTEEALLKVAKEYDVRVHPKVLVADILDIEKSGISDEEYSYALKVHFDFVGVGNDTTALFAVECGGLSTLQTQKSSTAII